MTAIATPDLDALRSQLEAKRVQLQTRLLEAQLDTLNLVDPREPYLDSGSEFWLPIGGDEPVPPNMDRQGKGEHIPDYLTWWGLKQLRDQSRRLCAFNPFAKNALANRVNYIVGSRFTYTAEEVPGAGAQPGDVPAVQGVIEDFLDANDWCEREQQAVEQCDRDGEAFLRFFVQWDGRVLVRDIMPEQVKSPPGKESDPCYTFGIETDPVDAETRLAYHVAYDPRSPLTERVPAEDILHLCLNSHRTSKRGLPTLWPVRRNLERIDKILRNMSQMAQIQASIALIRYHAGQSAANVQSFQQAAAAYQYQAPFTGRTETITKYPPGAILDASAADRYEFPSGNVNAAAFVGIVQAELRAVAALLVMPEYMLSSDASNANYSSTMVAESPAVRNFERLQSWFKGKFGLGLYGPGRQVGVIGRVIRAAVEAGRLPPRVLRTVTVKVEAPSLTTRDPLQEAQVRDIETRAGVLSPQTWCELEGRDYAIESQRIAEHQERFGPGPGALPMPGDGGGAG